MISFDLDLAVTLPASLEEAILDVWAEVDGMALDEALECFTAGLALVPHAWSKAHQTLAAETVLTPPQALRLALLTLGELPSRDERRFERIQEQPWYRAYAWLADGFRERDRLAGLDDDLRWLIVDAVIDGCPSDTRRNAMQEATGWVSASARIDRERGLGPEAAIHRMWRLAARGLQADGYDDGSYELTFEDLARDARDADQAAELRLLHAFLSYASESSEPRTREQLRVALGRAEERGIDIAGLRAVCTPAILGWFFEGELPLSSDAVLPTDTGAGK